DPGPACYDGGGLEPTVTDANLTLGYLDPGTLLAGRLPIRADKAKAAIDERLAGPLDVGTDEAAAAVLRIVNNAMAEALRIVSVERGHDAREFSIVAFGGAGPMHAAELATELGVSEIIIPPIPGGFSALGLVATDLKRDYVKTFYSDLASAAPGDIAAVYDGMEQSARVMLAASGISEDRWVFERAADLRYPRQAYELTVAAPSGNIDADTLTALANGFHQKHHQTYGHENRNEAVQMVNLRLTAIGKLEGLALRQPVASGARDSRTGSRTGLRMVWFKDTGRVECAIHDRALMCAGDIAPGPAVIEAVDATIVVPPGWTARADDNGYIIMETTND
ncbi:MAG: hydantoinase/oxoprolinase family protein, partial [Alphaproteobacteria bacterium]|nr:hydantoinase/oxoprolinase family protein [Alphaproteobacteria bacterium]